jgi:hypothetical protein
MTDRIDGSLVPDDHRDIEHAQSLLGPDARPTGRLRLLNDRTSGRLQLEWKGEFGHAWFDVLPIDVDILPTRMYR